MPFDNRKKNAQAKLDDALQTHYRSYGACEQLADAVKEKFAERSYASLEAASTLGQVATFMGQIPISNQSNQDNEGKQDNFDVTHDQISDWQNRSETAAEILETIGGVGVGAGVGAAGVYAAWTAAGLGTASTGTAIAGLSGAAATSAKLAWFGGGALAVGGGGMTLGAAVLGGLPVIPIVVAFGIMARRRIKKFEEAVDEAIKEIDDAGRELARWRQTKNLVTLRTNELTDATKEIDRALRQLLAKCYRDNQKSDSALWRILRAVRRLLVKCFRFRDNQSDVETVASISGVLAQVVDIQITDEDGNIMNEDALKNAYRTHLIRTRRQELSKAYDRLHEAIAIREYDRAVRAAKHILSVITL